jgi:uncharacterized phage infection (PIP) family protein YhgE
MKSLTFVTTISRLAVLALLLPVGMLAAQNPDSPAVSKFLEEVKSHAALAEDDADTLASYTLSNLDWKTHGNQLNRMKEHVNDLIRESNQLSSMRDEGSPWQQEAIDRISALLPEMASSLTETINLFNTNKNQTKMKPYRDLTKYNQTLIQKAHEIISDFVDYSEAKAKAGALEKELQLPADSDSESGS